jgi:hypothetical protein
LWGHCFAGSPDFLPAGIRKWFLPAKSPSKMLVFDIDKYILLNKENCKNNLKEAVLLVLMIDIRDYSA